jgi:hypothetical protein
VIWRGLLSIPFALILGAAIHVDWHLARSHDHGGLSGGLSYHWLIAVPLFAVAAWYLGRRSEHPLTAGAITTGVAVVLGQVLEPLGEHLFFSAPLSAVFAPDRLMAFATFMTAGVLSYWLMTWLLSRRPTHS